MYLFFKIKLSFNVIVIFFSRRLFHVNGKTARSIDTAIAVQLNV